MIKNTKDGRYRVDIQPGGRNCRRYRKSFATKGEALRFEAMLIRNHTEGLEWNPEGSDKRRLSALIEIWYTEHGQHLKDGKARVRALNRACTVMGNPIAAKLKASDYLSYRNSRQNYDTNKSKVSGKTVNNELTYLKAVFNHLISTDQIAYRNPLINVKPLKLAERELSFLTIDQINELLSVIESTSQNPHLLLIVKICLSTGCRWSEAESLHTRQMQKNFITFVNTKSGKNRTVPIDSDLEAEIRAHGTGQLFTSSLNAFRKSLKRTSIILPAGQSSHVLRHSYASHFIMNGGDIRTLQLILGHSNITMTMRYSHLSPGHLAQAITLSPLAKCRRNADG